jgi:hypothetical protein
MSQISPTPGRMARAGVSTAEVVDFTGVDFMMAVSTAVSFTGGAFHDGRFHDGRFHDNRFFFGGSLAYPGWGYYPDYGYYDYSQPYSSQTWYYCSDPAGYYPYVTQCNTGWQAVPAS